MEAGPTKAFWTQLFAETYDRNFKMIIFLSSWGPIWGMRYNTRYQQVGLVVAGVTTAYFLRVLAAVLLEESVNDRRTTLSNFISPLFLIILSVKATLDYNEANQRHMLMQARPSQTEAITAASQEAGTPSSSAVAAASEGEDKEPAETLERPKEATDGPSPEPMLEKDGEPKEERKEPLLMAFVIPFCCNLCVSVSNPLEGSEAMDSLKFLSVFPIVTGAFLAASLAVSLGTVLEHTLTERRFLLCASVSLSLTSVQAISASLLFYIWGLTFDVDQ